MKYKCGTTCPPVNGIPCIVICPPSSYSYDFSLPKDFNIKAPAPSIRSSSNWASAGHTTNNSNYTPSIPAPFISSLPKYAVSTNASENNSPKNTRLTSKPQFQSLLEKINNPQHGRLVPEKVINLSNNNLQNGDILLLVQKLQYQALNLDLLDFSKNQISFTGVENILYSFHFDAPNGRYIVTMNLSNNIIGDDGAEYIATSLKWGRYPHLKALDVSGNQITPAGHGYIAQALKAVNQTIAVTLVKSKEVSKAILKETMKGMLYIAKNNGITTNEMLTNDQTVEYCKKGGINVLKNIIWGGITCNTKLGRAVDLAELDMGTIENSRTK